jgi:hypothetical protein
MRVSTAPGITRERIEMDECLFLKYDNEIVEDEQDPLVQIHYHYPICLIAKADMGSCPFPARTCAYKDLNDAPDIGGTGITFTDGSTIEDLSGVR